MVTLLTKLFLKNAKNDTDPEVRKGYGILCGALGIALNLFLFLAKFLAGTFSGSVAITADAFNNLSDAGSSIITLIGFKMAGQKPDPAHPFGHGRIEYISGLLVSVVILLMGLELVKSSFVKILHPQALVFTPLIPLILVLSILVKFYMYLYNKRIGKKIDSAAMLAASTDSLSDTAATAAVLLSTLVSHFFRLQIDGYSGILVGIFILRAGITAAKETISPLLGQAPDPAFVQKIYDIVLSYDNVVGVHDLIVHNYGPGRTLISLHAEVPATGDILVLHDMIDLIERRLNEECNCHAVIHMDPVCIGDEETDRLKALTVGYLQEIDPALTLHDFRIVKGPTHTNIIFDVVVPYRFQLTDNELIAEITAKLKSACPNDYAVIQIDRKYS